MAIDHGEFVGLLGANGSGKSSVLRCIYGDLTPSAGTVALDGVPLNQMSRRDRARRMAVMTQDTGGDWDYTVEEVVALGRIPHKPMFARTTAADQAIVARALAAVDGLHLQRFPVRRLSGGERQRIMLARVLAQEPQMLILDEPTNHLDIRFQIELMQRIRELGRTSLAVLHDLNLAAAFCDRVVLLQAGRVVAAGAPRDVFTEPLIQAVYGIPSRVDRIGTDIVVRYWF
jgi:iron complex transport system ATP-binding protein